MQAHSIAPAPASTTPPAASTSGPALIVFGRDERGKPHASAFGSGDAALGERAAALMGMAVLRVGAEHEALAAQVSRGRVFASGRAFVPFVKGALFANLEAAASGEPVSDDPTTAAAIPVASNGVGGPETGTYGPGEPEGGRSGVDAASNGNTDSNPAGGPADPARNWDGIGVSSVVLATTGEKAEGWFESVVTRVVDAGLFELRWRDYDEPNFIRRRDHLALLPPALASRI